MINTNDLIGLEYGWGHAPGDGSGKTDCFQLACEIHKRLGFGDYTAKFQWVYDEYDDKTFPRSKIARWMLANGTRLAAPTPGAVMLLPVQTGAAMASYLEDGTTIYIGPMQTVLRIALPATTGHLFWMDQ